MMSSILYAVHLFHEAFVMPIGERHLDVGIPMQSWNTLNVNGEKIRYFYAESGVYVFDRGFDTFTISKGGSPFDAWVNAMIGRTRR